MLGRVVGPTFHEPAAPGSNPHRRFSRARHGALNFWCLILHTEVIFELGRLHRSVGLMDQASASGAGDSRLESWADDLLQALNTDVACPGHWQSEDVTMPPANHDMEEKATTDMATLV